MAKPCKGAEQGIANISSKVFFSTALIVSIITLACGTVSQVAKGKGWLCWGPSQVCLLIRACIFLWGFPNSPSDQQLSLDPRQLEQFSELGRSPKDVLWSSHLTQTPLNFKRKQSVLQADVSNLSIEQLWCCYTSIWAPSKFNSYSCQLPFQNKKVLLSCN